MPELWESDDESCTDYDDMPELDDLYESGELHVETERFSFNLAALNAEKQQEYLVYGDTADDTLSLTITMSRWAKMNRKHSAKLWMTCFRMR
jgi:hypothetical protein